MSLKFRVSNGRTDKPTDTPSYRDARTHLKMKAACRKGSDKKKRLSTFRKGVEFDENIL